MKVNIMEKKVIGIIGLGLIGGSLGLALKEIGKYRVIGYDRNPKHREDAFKLDLVDEVVSSDEVERVDILFLAIPVEGIISTLQNLKHIKDDTTIIDMGSTKEKIVRSIPPKLRKNFVAAHPMAGTEKSGPSASFKSLYQDKVVVLCDIEDSGEKQRRDSEEIFNYLQMKIIYMGASEHDTHTAWISHLPHVLSFALANSVMAQENRESILNLSAGGFRDMSRLAKSSPKMWRDIFKQNRENLLDSISYFQKEFDNFKNMIEQERWDEVEDAMKSANRLHEIL